MKDLKHLIFFEDLLQEANNELVRKGKEEGLRAIGYTCYFMPEVLLDLPGCFSVRLRAPRCTSPDIATYYLSSRVCHYARSLMERAGGWVQFPRCTDGNRNVHGNMSFSGASAAEASGYGAGYADYPES